MSAKNDTASIREATQKAWKDHPKSELHVTVTGTTASGGAEKDIEIDAADGYLRINTHGEVRLDRESCITLQKRLEQAFQVVA